MPLPSGSPGGRRRVAHLGVERDRPGHKVDPAHYGYDDVEREGVYNGHLWTDVAQAGRR